VDGILRGDRPDRATAGYANPACPGLTTAPGCPEKTAHTGRPERASPMILSTIERYAAGGLSADAYRGYHDPAAGLGLTIHSIVNASETKNNTTSAERIAASELYNTRIEHYITVGLGGFSPKPKHPNALNARSMKSSASHRNCSNCGRRDALRSRRVRDGPRKRNAGRRSPKRLIPTVDDAIELQIACATWWPPELS
jgi:hypothetical protein